MSRILKRPMFRKGGEVMEGIMTGIKPREMFRNKGMSDSMRDELKNIQSRVNLIDAFSGAGASPLGDPLTQFLLQTGQNLISGESAGGTKLQEIVGATRKPLDKAIKAQQVKDLSRRKIAASLLSKMGADDIAKIRRNAKKIADVTGRDENKVFNSLLNKFMYQDEQSPGTILQKEKGAFKKALLADEKFGQKIFKPQQADAVTDAYFKAVQKSKENKNFKIDNNMFAIPPKKLKELKPKIIETAQGKKTVFEPPADLDFVDKFTYYDLRGEGKYLYFDETQNILIPLGK